MEKIDDFIDAGLCHEIHTSNIKSFRGCRRRWNWIANEHYYPVVTPRSLAFGIAYHRALEVYYDPMTWGVDRNVAAALAIVEFTKSCDAQLKRYLKLELLDQLGLEKEDQEKFNAQKELGVGMLKYFFYNVAPNINITPVRVEIPFRIPITHPKTGEQLWCKCDECRDKSPLSSLDSWQGLPVVYAGRCDAIVKDEHGDLYILDWKTTSRFMDDLDYWLQLDDQVGSYVMALRHVIGIDIKGFIYVEMKKAVPEPPKENKRMREGRRYSVDKTMATTYEMYLETVRDGDPAAFEAGLYDPMLAFLNGEGAEYVRWHKIRKTDHELIEISKIISAQALDMLSDTLLIYPSPGRFQCQFCAFKVPCVGKFQGEDVQYILDQSGLFEKREHYYVRQEPSTESKGSE